MHSVYYTVTLLGGSKLMLHVGNLGKSYYTSFKKLSRSSSGRYACPRDLQGECALT
jgi:hypothetical protein